MGCFATKPEIEHFAKYGDITDFVEIHCELDPKAHTAYNEVASALLVFMQLRGRHHANVESYWHDSLMKFLIQEYGLTNSGSVMWCNRTIGGKTQRSWSNVFLVGIRIVLFPAHSHSK